MKKHVKNAALLLPLLGLSACFETTSAIKTIYEGRASVCPLNQNIKYSINSVGKGGTKKVGTLRTVDIYGGACNVRDLDGLDYATSQNVMYFIGSRFYDLGNGIKIGFNGAATKKPPKLDQYFVLARIQQNGEIEIFSQCSDEALKPANNPAINCTINDANNLRVLSENLKYLKPSVILKPLK